MFAAIQRFWEVIASWWTEFTLQTKLMAAATLAVSLIVSGVTFWAVNTIQVDARVSDTRFGRDLGLLLAANVAPQLAEDNLADFARFANRFYQTTSSLHTVRRCHRHHSLGDSVFRIGSTELFDDRAPHPTPRELGK
jgi:two-component system, OmpR family, sensor histidine kinase NblS